MIASATIVGFLNTPQSAVVVVVGLAAVSLVFVSVAPLPTLIKSMKNALSELNSGLRQAVIMFRSNAQTVLRESISLFARTKMLPVTISIKKTTTNRQVRTTLSLIRRPAISM